MKTERNVALEKVTLRTWTSCLIPGVANRTFGNRTQSDFNPLIDLESNIIEHFFNRTETNSDRPTELCLSPALCHSKLVSFGFKQCVAAKSDVASPYNFESGCQRLSRVLFRRQCWRKVGC